MTFTVQENTTLRAFTDNTFAQASFCLSYLLKNKEIKVNGVKISKDMPLQKGDEVVYFLTAKQREKKAFYSVYEDENVHIVDKESGVNAEAVFAELSRQGEYYFIHRLDRNTRGIMAFAKTKNAEKILLDVFKNRKVEKCYECVCFGIPKQKSALLTAYLKKDERSSTVRVFDIPQNGAERIVTEYDTRDSWMQEGEELSLLDVTLHTGKTHQIRAHLSHIGCPIVGDMKYGDSVKNRRFKAERQRLISKKLRLEVSGELAYLSEMVFCSKFDVKADFIKNE